MARVYIDCGAWNGDSIITFKKKYGGEQDDIYAFECHPKHYDELSELSKKENFTFINKAVWIEDTKVPMYLGVDDLSQSSTLYKDKKKFIDKDNPVLVEAMDFSYWLAGKFHLSDNIICKMNIEGAEYDVLEKMIKDQTIDLINKLYVAWHFTKIQNFSVRRHMELVKNLKQKVKLIEWDFHERNPNPFI